jgi:outer membrane immunogenic protein
MKKLLLSSVALAGLTATAMAADLPSRRAAPAPYVAVPVFTWTGFYVGVNAGYGFSDSNKESTLSSVNILGASAPLGAPGSTGIFGQRNNNDGFVGGGQVGYNYQVGQFVIGFEGDIQYTDFGGRSGRFGNNAFQTYAANSPLIVNPIAGSPGNVAYFNNTSLGSRSEFFGTVRGRLGYAFDRVLVYGTGGVAFRDTNSTGTGGFVNGADPTLVNQAFYNGPLATTLGGTFVKPGFVRRAPDDTGYVVGGGVEYAFTPNITAKVEGIYVNFGNNGAGAGGVIGVTNNGSAVIQTARRRDDDFAVVRAGLNYKFNAF